MSFSHPAKVAIGLQEFLIDRYSKPGDIILDPDLSVVARNLASDYRRRGK